MAKGKLFEMAILYHPRTKKNPTTGEELESKASIIVAAPKTIVAVSEKEVGIRAAKEIPAEYDDKLEDIEILIRPFN